MTISSDTAVLVGACLCTCRAMIPVPTIGTPSRTRMWRTWRETRQLSGRCTRCSSRVSPFPSAGSRRSLRASDDAGAGDALHVPFCNLHVKYIAYTTVYITNRGATRDDVARPYACRQALAGVRTRGTRPASAVTGPRAAADSAEARTWPVPRLTPVEYLVSHGGAYLGYSSTRVALKCCTLPHMRRASVENRDLGKKGRPFL